MCLFFNGECTVWGGGGNGKGPIIFSRTPTHHVLTSFYSGTLAKTGMHQKKAIFMLPSISESALHYRILSF